MHLRQFDDASLASGIAAALAGGSPVAPICEPRLTAALHLDAPVTEPDAALVVPTSGTTSEPKAVVLSASAIRFAAEATHERLGGAGDWMCALPTQHVAGLMTICRAVVAGSEVRFIGTDLAELPHARGRSYVSVVAAQLDRVLTDRSLTDRLASYAAVLVGGSAVRPKLLAAAREAGINTVTTYGASETCGGCVYDGRPLAGVRITVTDERIGLAGPMAFSGYRLRPDLTATVLHGDLVVTNDRGRLIDGRLEVFGRCDDVVISGGHKVDLAQVQRCCERLFGSPQDGGPVLLSLPDPRWGAKVVAVSTAKFDLDQLQQQLTPLVGAAAVPKELRQVPKLAYTSLGKIDRVALRLAWERKGRHGDNRAVG